MINVKGNLFRLKPLVSLVSLLSWQISAQAEAGVDAYRVGEYTQAAQIFTQQAPKNADGQFAMAEMYLYGYGLPRNTDKAVEWYMLSASNGYLPALQVISRYELLIKKQPEEALKWFKKAADLGDLPSQMYVSAAYIYGLGTSKNEDMAKKYYIAAAKQGSPLAQMTLAQHFFDSKQSSNNQLAWIWLNKACDKKYPPALLLKAKLLAEGKKTASDPKQARELLTQVIAMKYAPAYALRGQWALADKKFSLAENSFKTAISQGYQPAELMLANLYAMEDTPVTNQALAFQYMNKAALRHESDAEKSLSDFYAKGIGVEANAELAADWLKQSKRIEKQDVAWVMKNVANWLSAGKYNQFGQGDYRLKGIWFDWHNPQALLLNRLNAAPQFIQYGLKDIFQPQYDLVRPYQIPLTEYLDAMMRLKGPLAMPGVLTPHYVIGQGEGLSQTEFTNIKQQAFLGVAESQFMLGQCYLKGEQVTPNTAEARVWFAKAMDQDDLRAQYELALIDLASEDDAVQKQGLLLLKDAAYKGNANAEYSLGLLSEKGVLSASGKVVMAPNIEQAKNMYRLASVNDLAMAKYRLAEWLSRDPLSCLSVADRTTRQKEIRELYQQAVNSGIKQAELPLAFYQATSNDARDREWAFNTARNYAAEGNQEAALLVGLMIDRKVQNQNHTEDAKEWYAKAKKHPIGGFIWASLNPASDNAETYLHAAGDAGFSYAYLNLAVTRHQHQKSSVEELQKAVSMNNILASHLLANQLMLSENASDRQQSLSIFNQLAAKGDAEAEMKLGYMLVNGWGCVADANVGEKWLLQAAAQKHPKAQMLLGIMNHTGQLSQGVNDEEAKRWFRLAANQMPKAWIDLGFIYETVDKQYDTAYQAYQKGLSAQTTLSSQYNQGLIFQYGKGLPVDVSKATDHLLLAAKAGSSYAMLELGDIYLFKTTDKQEAEALNWYQKAAKSGQAEAYYRLGLMTETGIATDVNYPLAIKYYEKADKLGYVSAKQALNRISAYKMESSSTDKGGFIDRCKYAINHFTGGGDGSSLDMQYLMALDALNHGQVDVAQKALTKMVNEYPFFMPAKHLYMKLQLQTRPSNQAV